MYKLFNIKRESAIINLLSRPTKFLTTVIKLHHQKVQEKKEEENKESIKTPGSYDNDEQTGNREKSAQFEKIENKLDLQPEQEEKRQLRKKLLDVMLDIDHSTFLTDTLAALPGQYATSRQKKVTSLIEKKVF